MESLIKFLQYLAGVGPVGAILALVGVIFTAILTFVGVILTLFWEWRKVKSTYKNEVNKYALTIFYEHARKYYITICFYSIAFADRLKYILEKRKEGCIDEPTIELQIKFSLYMYGCFQYEWNRFGEEAGKMWFLKELEAEKQVVDFETKIIEYTPFNYSDDAFLADSVFVGSKLISFHQFEEKLKSSPELGRCIKILSSWIECNCSNHERCPPHQLADFLYKYTDLILEQFNKGFSFWYKRKWFSQKV